MYPDPKITYFSVLVARFPEQICLIRNSLIDEYGATPSILLKHGRAQGVSTELLVQDDPPNLDDPYYPGM